MTVPFLDRDRHSSLPRLGPIPVPPHSLLYPCPDAPSLDCDGNNSWAQETSSAHERSEHSGSEWLQGWLADTRPGQVFWLDRGPFWEKGMRNAVDLKALNREILSSKITEEAERAIFGIVLQHPNMHGSDFYDSRHRRISVAMVDLVGKEEGIDRLTLADPLERHESLKRLSCRAAPSKLLTTIGSPAKIVRFNNFAEAP